MEAGRQTALLQAHPIVRRQVHPIARLPAQATVLRIKEFLRQHALLHRLLIVLHRVILPGLQGQEEAVA